MSLYHLIKCSATKQKTWLLLLACEKLGFCEISGFDWTAMTGTREPTDIYNKGSQCFIRL